MKTNIYFKTGNTESAKIARISFSYFILFVYHYFCFSYRKVSRERLLINIESGKAWNVTDKSLFNLSSGVLRFFLYLSPGHHDINQSLINFDFCWPVSTFETCHSLHFSLIGFLQRKNFKCFQCNTICYVGTCLNKDRNIRLSSSCWFTFLNLHR